MNLYYGLDIEIREPNISFSRKNLDFGLGFYTTPYFEKAKKWSM